MKLFNLYAATLAAPLLAATAAAQVTVISTESFEYASPGLLHAQTGGTGWGDQWYVSGAPGAEADIVIFNPSVMPTFPGSDGVGNYAGQAVEFGAAFRRPDVAAHPDLQAPDGRFGADGTTMWFSWTTQNYQNFGDHYGGFILADALGDEEVFMGSPWASYGHGIDDEGPAGAMPEIIPGSNDAIATRLVVRVDYQAGAERLRMWRDPATPYPVSPAELDTTVHDHTWDEIRLSSGGNAGNSFWDNIVIAKGVPELGTPICTPNANNSTGLPSTFVPFGSDVVADNDLNFQIDQLPLNATSMIIASPGQVNVANPGGGTGNLCVGPFIGRAAGGVFSSGATGSATIPVDVNLIPTPTGPEAMMPGDTRYFQVWHRDTDGMGMATSHFGDAVCITFQ